MLKNLFLVAAFVASVSAVSVTYPYSGVNYTTDGQNKVSWSSVSTDPKNFTITLSNGNPSDDQQLDALVDTGLGTIEVNPPSEGWPASGAGPYTINIVASAENTNSILAQSPKFFFQAPKTSSTSAPVQTAAVQTAPTTQPTDDTTSTDNTTTTVPPASGESGASGLGANTVLLTALVLLCAGLA